MMIWQIIKEILNIAKYRDEIKNLFSFFKKNGLFSPLIIFSLIGIGISCYLITTKINFSNHIYNEEEVRSCEDLLKKTDPKNLYFNRINLFEEEFNKAI